MALNARDIYRVLQAHEDPSFPIVPIIAIDPDANTVSEDSVYEIIGARLDARDGKPVYILQLEWKGWDG